MIKKIHHVGIVVRKLEEAFEFYKDTLGLPLGKMATSSRSRGESRIAANRRE